MAHSDETRVPSYDELLKKIAKLQSERPAGSGLSSAIRNFDALPDAAMVQDNDVAALEGVSKSTIWRWVASGRYPAPTKQCGVTRWSVGSIRRHHAARAAKVAEPAAPKRTREAEPA